MNELYHISSGPHTRGRLNTSRIMIDVVISMLPAAAVGVWYFGVRALWIILLSVGVLGDYIGRIFMESKKRPVFIPDVTNIDKKENGKTNQFQGKET